jgi:hypothetical protein
MISHAELVESILGYWPEFADGLVEYLSFEYPDIVCLRIFYIDADLEKKIAVSLRFTGVTELDLGELRSQNTIDALHVSEASPATVTIEACCGVCGTFKCTSAEVTSVVPNYSSKPTC